MKHIWQSLAFFFIFACSIPVFSQVAVNPSDSFYADVEIWETAGIIADLPPLRPYPLALVKKILTEVIESGRYPYTRNAKEQYERIFGKAWHVGFTAESGVSVGSGNEVPYQIKGMIFFQGDMELFDLASISFDINGVGSNKSPSDDLLPLYVLSNTDVVDDPAEIGPVKLFFVGNVASSIGTDSIYVQAGVNRNSFGPFYTNGVTFGPQAFHAGNISFVVNQDTWNFTTSLHMIAASDNRGGGSFANKFLALHSIEFRPFDWFSLIYYESIVYGNRFDPIYILPVPFMISQGLGGFNDNLQMGVIFKVKPVAGLLWNTNIMIDDINANELLKLDFDTRIKIAGQTGISWAPENSLFSLVGVDYTMVAPYMYTHSQYARNLNGGETLLSGGGINFQNYTNKGFSLGASIPPNSDRMHITFRMEPIRNLILNFSTNVVRHANINESIPTEDAKWYLAAGKEAFLTDGSVFDYYDAGYGYFDYAWSQFMFMEQETKQYTWQCALNSTYQFPQMPVGIFTVQLGYTFEYIKNDGVATNMFPGAKEGSEAATEDEAAKITDQAVRDAREAWKAQLHDTINNYIFLSVKLLY